MGMNAHGIAHFANGLGYCGYIAGGTHSICGYIAEPEHNLLHVRRGHGCLGTWTTYEV